MLTYQKFLKPMLSLGPERNNRKDYGARDRKHQNGGVAVSLRGLHEGQLILAHIPLNY